MNCNEALPMVPGYLDGELSEAQAGPLRRHLLDCSACREAAVDGKALRAWFPRDVAARRAPATFASRVARLAFAGARATVSEVAIVPVPPRAPAAGRASASASDLAPTLDFVLRATAVAAAVLLVLALMLQYRTTPTGTDMRAEEVPTDVLLPEVLDELYRANGGAAPPVDPLRTSAAEAVPPGSESIGPAPTGIGEPGPEPGARR